MVEKVMAAAVKEAKKGRANITHFIPCRLMYAKEPNTFEVGAVTFKTHDAFTSEMLPVYERYLAAQPSESPSVRDPYYLDEAKDYCTAFSWVAQVKILKCDDVISKERATLAVTAAVDILHIKGSATVTDRPIHIETPIH